MNKTMKTEMKKTLGAVLFNCVMGMAVALLFGFNLWLGAIGANILAALATPFMARSKDGVAMAGVLRELWTGELVKALRGGQDATFLAGVPDMSSVVDNDVIHLVDVGADPDVLIDNTTYPLATQKLDDGDISISLAKFQTRPTPVTDDELYAISYDKMARVKEAHANALNDAKFVKAAHALCAKQNTAKTPVIKTTGDADAETGRKKMTLADVINMKRTMDKLGVPAKDRRLVLCQDHVNDLLSSEQAFREQYNINRADGTVGRLYGFDIYEYAENPVYTTAGVKKAVGSTAAEGEYQCSFAFYVPRVFKATGSTKMYYSEAATDPTNQQNLIDYRHYFVCLPKKEDAGVVIING